MRLLFWRKPDLPDLPEIPDPPEPTDRSEEIAALARRVRLQRSHSLMSMFKTEIVVEENHLGPRIAAALRQEPR